VQEFREATVAQGPLAIWTTGVWERESMVMRWLERKLVDAVENWSTPPVEGTVDTSVFTEHYVEPEPPIKLTVMESVLARLRRA
jgi:phosphatidylglycerophosphatase GEP4